MKKFIYGLSFCLLLSQSISISAQISLPASQGQFENNIEANTFFDNIMEIDYLMQHPNWFISNETNKAYYRYLSQLVDDNMDREVVISNFLEKYPTSFNRDQLTLMMGLIALKNKDYNRSLYHLKTVDKVGLNNQQKAKYDLAYAYALYQQNPLKAIIKGQERNTKINKLLSDALQYGNEWSEKSLFFLSSFKWLEGDKRTAYNIYRDTHWSSPLKKEASYMSAIMMYDLYSTNKAILNTKKLWEEYPEMRTRMGINRLIGIAYYKLGDIPNAIKYLLPLWKNNREKMDMLSCYVLGASLYQQGQYLQAEAPLLVACTQHSKYQALAQLLLGNTYAYEGKKIDAISLYTSAAVTANYKTKVRALAMYNNALLQNNMGVSNFGQSVRLAMEYIKEYPNTPKAEVMSSLLSRAFLSSKDYEQSLSSINKINNPNTEIKKAKQYVLCKLAEEKLVKDEFSDAILYLRQAIQMGPISEYYDESLLHLGNIELQQKDYKEASSTLQEVINRHPNPIWKNGLAFYALGYVYFNQNLYKEAYQTFQRFVNDSQNVPQYLSDAFLRMGDCMYQNQTNLALALLLYNKAEQVANRGSDEALIKLANIYAIKGQYMQQINIINKVLNRSQDRSIWPKLLYQKGRAMVLSKQPTNKVIDVFNDIIQNYSDTKYARLAGLEKAMTYYNAGNKEEAITSYKEVINHYPQSQEAIQALNDLKNIYLLNNNLGEYLAYAKTLGGEFSPSKQEEAKLMYMQAEQQYREGDTTAITTLKNYILQYPQSINTIKAKSELADLYYDKGKLDEAESLYTSLSVDSIEVAYRIPALLRLGEIQYAANNFIGSEATYYKLYHNKNLSKEDLKIAYIGLIRSLYKNHHYKEVISYTNDKIMKSLQLDNIDEMILLRGQSYQALKLPKKALVVFESIDKNTETLVGAESYVLSSDILFHLGKKTKAKEKIQKFIKQSTPQQYWLARAFILLSDIYYSEGDKYKAKQYIESLNENYQNPPSDIEDMIQQRLNKFSK